MYRTDKQFMKNPATAGSRIYIGNLNKTTVSADLEDIFKKHGNIVGLSLNMGFAFIQFENDEEAQNALKHENGTMLNGRKINVKQAMDKSKPGSDRGMPQRGPPPPRPGGPPQRGLPTTLPKLDIPPPRQNNPLLQKTPPPPSQRDSDSIPPKNQPEQRSDLKFQPPEKDAEFQDENMEDDRPNIRPPPGPQFNDDRGRKDMRKVGGGGGRGGPRGRSNDRERFPGRDRFGNGPRDELRFEPPPVDVFREREPFYGRENYGPPPRAEPFPAPALDQPPPAPEKNDCEIIVVSKALTEYAEFIEQKLKTLGLIVDLLFPNEDVPIGKVLANISSRGCLYAILVMPINEEHRSLTLNILHGMPQEHRNMPIEDAMILMSRNFEGYMKGEHLPADSVSQMSLLDRHPTPIQMLVNLLAENRQLSTAQYDQIIKYLQEKRELQHEHEVEEGITSDSQEPDSKQAELQNRILNILNKSNDSPIPTSITAPEPAPAPTESTPILKDPTVQKALDSLMLGDMFKNIATTV